MPVNALLASCRRLSSLAALLVAAFTGPLQAQATSPPTTVSVRSYSVNGNTLLPAAQLDAVLAPFKGPQTLAGLQGAVAALQAAYRAAGWGAVVVSLPVQDLAPDAEVRLTVLEGKVTRIGLAGQPRWGEPALRALLPTLQLGQTPRLARIDREIQLLNDGGGPLVALTLESGDKPGEVDARLQVQDSPAHPWRLSLDNTGNKQTGHLRLGLAWQDPQWSAAGDSLGLQFQTSPTHPSRVVILSGQYSRPLPAWLGRLDAYAALSNVDGGDTPTAAGALRFQGKGHTLGLRLTRLIESSGSLDARLSVALDQRAYRNDCRVAGLPPGACGAAGESVTVQPLSLELALQPGDLPGTGLSLAWSRNLALGGAFTSAAQFQAVRPGAPRGFEVWRLNGQFMQPLGQRLRAVLRVGAQLSGDALVSGEQFGIAGANTVRGYNEREIVGDSAGFASLELHGPLLAEQWRPVVFVDGGEARNRLGTECRAGASHCTLWSAGLGLRGSLNIASGTGQWRLDGARAGRTANTTQRGDWRLHLAASLSI